MAMKKAQVKGLVLTVSALLLIGALSAWIQEVRRVALLALGLQWFVFLVHGAPCHSEQYYDLSGSLTHISVIAASLPETPSRRQLIVSGCALIWAVRLGTFLFVRICCADGRDSRFNKMRDSPIAFSAAWTIQALWVVTIQLPVILINTSPSSDIGLSDALAMTGFLIGFSLEFIADAQKFSFRTVNHDTFIRQGLWRYSRHPNFCGEILIWTSFGLLAFLTAGLDASPRPAALLSPLFTYTLLTRVSGIPLLEKSYFERYGNDSSFQHYYKHTSTLVPWFPAPALANEKKTQQHSE